MGDVEPQMDTVEVAYCYEWLIVYNKTSLLGQCGQDKALAVDLATELARDFGADLIVQER